MQELLFEFLKIGRQPVNAQGGRKRGGVLDAREDFDEVLEVGQVIVDRRGGEQEHGLVLREVVELPIA